MSRPEWAWLDNQLRRPFDHDAVQLACDQGHPPDVDDDEWVLRHIEG